MQIQRNINSCIVTLTCEPPTHPSSTDSDHFLDAISQEKLSTTIKNMCSGLHGHYGLAIICLFLFSWAMTPRDVHQRRHFWIKAGTQVERSCDHVRCRDP
jgi:hypothetical protein